MIFIIENFLWKRMTDNFLSNQPGYKKIFTDASKFETLSALSNSIVILIQYKIHFLNSSFYLIAILSFMKPAKQSNVASLRLFFQQSSWMVMP